MQRAAAMWHATGGMLECGRMRREAERTKALTGAAMDIEGAEPWQRDTAGMQPHPASVPMRMQDRFA
jgi:hypothetical protein